MSLSITPSDVIRNHPANNSSSKQIHRFSKSKRFNTPNPQCSNAFYNNQSHLSNRKASFGYGHKFDFTKTTVYNPPANNYQIQSFIDQNKGKGSSFGLDRQKMSTNSYLIPQMRKTPGPGTYQNINTLNSPSFTMRSKPVDFIELKATYKKSPGPGTHEELNMIPKKGRFSVSKYRDTLLSVIHQPKTERFLTIKPSPGPNYYREGERLNGQGKYLLSTHKSQGRRLFSKAEKIKVGYYKTIDTPGPGSYQQVSQFGHYGSAGYYKALNK